MGVLDFLFQGTTPSSSTGVSSTSVPAWLQQYTQGILAEGAGVASQPYQQYGGPRVAETTADQNSAYGTIRGLQGQYQGPIAQATQMATSASNPGAIGQALGQLPQAQQYINQSLNPGSTINPYVNNVIKQGQNQATNYWNDTLKPSIDNEFTDAGQFGSSAHERAANQGAARINQQIQDTANSAYAGAYTNAQQANLAAGNATGTIAQTTGGLGYEQGVLGMQGASQLGNLATTGQNLGIQGAGALDTAGMSQQNQNQQNLNLGYQDFMNQQQYPYQQVGWLSQLMNGTVNNQNTPGAKTTTQTGYPTQTGTSPLMGAIGAYTSSNP